MTPYHIRPEWCQCRCWASSALVPFENRALSRKLGLYPLKWLNFFPFLWARQRGKPSLFTSRWMVHAASAFFVFCLLGFDRKRVNIFFSVTSTCVNVLYHWNFIHGSTDFYLWDFCNRLFYKLSRWSLQALAFRNIFTFTFIIVHKSCIQKKNKFAVEKSIILCKIFL